MYSCGHMVANRYRSIYPVFQFYFIYNFLETGGIMITPRPAPNNSIPKPGFPMIPFFGVEPVLMNDKVSIYLSIYV